MFPLMDPSHFVGALWDPVEGHLDPAGTTHAYAKAAQKLGATIVLRERAVELTQDPDGTWNVVTEHGTVRAEHVVNAGGLWAREVGRMVGLELPVLAMEHMYLVTDDMPEVIAYNKERGRELPHIIDFKSEIYMRQERSGIVLGTYEKECKPWQPKQTPWILARAAAAGFDRIADHLEIITGIFRWLRRDQRTAVRLPPDGNPLVGPVQGLRTPCLCRDGKLQPGVVLGWRSRNGW
jgi:dimethylglycine dehydrogenase